MLGETGVDIVLTTNNVLIVVAICLMVLGICFFLNVVIRAVYSILVLETKEACELSLPAQQRIEISVRQFIFIVLTAIVAITICSKASPIYPFDDSVDVNAFMTVGRGMLHGLVPYRDLYEQKGPLVYMLHAMAALVSETTFIGVYFFEIIAAVCFLFFGFKLMKLYQRTASVLLVPILAAVVYSAHSFHHGDTVEELCLPLLAFAIYLVVRLIRQRKMPSWWEFMMVGVTSACVLWMKFSLLGFYFGWFCIIAWQLVRCKAFKKLFSVLLWIGIGVLIPTVPILLYFGMHHALADLWTVYFYNNVVSYSNISDGAVALTWILNLCFGLIVTLLKSPVPTALLITGLLVLLKKTDKQEFFAYLVMGTFTFLMQFIGGRHYDYYPFILSAFVPIGVLSVCRTLQVHLFAKYQSTDAFIALRKFAVAIICAGSFSFTFAMCNNTYLLAYDKSELPQYLFAEIMNQKEDATLLNYGFLDGGFYMAAGVLPNCRFFCNLNIELDEMTATQDEFVEQGKVDFVVTRDMLLPSERYECIAATTFSFEGYEHYYFLYQLCE